MKVTGREKCRKSFLIEFFQNEWIFTSEIDCLHCWEHTAIYQEYYAIPGFKCKAKLGEL